MAFLVQPVIFTIGICPYYGGRLHGRLQLVFSHLKPNLYFVIFSYMRWTPTCYNAAANSQTLWSDNTRSECLFRERTFERPACIHTRIRRTDRNTRKLNSTERASQFKRCSAPDGFDTWQSSGCIPTAWRGSEVTSDFFCHWLSFEEDRVL